MSNRLYPLSLSFLCGVLVLNPAFAQSNLPTPTDTDHSVPMKALPLPENTDVRVLDAAYQTYLANKEVAEAYHVAVKAVEKYPHDLQWRERLANAALWNNKGRVAVAQWLYVATHKVDNLDAIEKGIHIAEQLHAYDALITLYQLRMKHPMPEKRRKQYDLLLTVAYAKSGAPEDAIAFLQSKPIDQLTKEEIQTLITLHYNLYETQQVLVLIDDYEKRFGLTVHLALQKAKILTDQNKLGLAFETLKSVQDAPDTTVAYWQQLGELAWQTQHLPVAALAYEKLFSLEKYSEHELQRLIILYEKEKKERAFDLAVFGWEKFKTEYFFQQVIYLGLTLNKLDHLKLLMDGLNPEQRQKFEATKSFKETEILYYQAKKNWDKVSDLYLNAIKNFPADNAFRRDYLWFLIDRELDGLLKVRTEQWQSLAVKTPDLWDVYASAYIKLKEDAKAELFYKKLIVKYPDDYRWYMGLSAALGGGDLGGAQTKQGALSRAARLRAWQLLNQMLAKDHGFKNAEETNNYAYLSMQFGAPDFSDSWMRRLDHDSNDGMLNSILMDMLFFKEYHHMSHLLLAHYKHSPLTIENWIHLRAALIDGDTDEMAHLLEYHAKTLPERDRPIAAERSGQPRLAQQLAFEGLENKSYDNNLYDIYQNLVLKYPNKWQTATGYRSFTGLSGPEVNALIQQLIGLHSALIVRTYNWLPKLTDTSQISRAPDVVHYLLVGFIRYFQEGQLLAAVGERHAFKTNPTGLFQFTYPVNHLITTYFDLGFNQESTDSVPLRLVGMRDYFNARASILFTTRDQLSLRMGDDLLYGEDRTYLGNAWHTEIAFDHAYRFAYPDPHLIFSIAHHHNSRASALSSFMRQFIPANAVGNTFYIPQSSTDFNVLLTLGMKYLDEYTHGWRPFFSLGAAYNTEFGFGYSANVGIAGSVMGRDHLAFFTEYAKSTSDTGGEPTLYIAAKYTYYY